MAVCGFCPPPGLNRVKVIGIRPMALVLNTSPLEGIEQEMLSFSIRK